MKKLILLIILLPIYINAQTVSGIGAMKNDTIAKRILDYAQLRVYYRLVFEPDPTAPKIEKEAETLLQIGNKVSRFMDYNEFRLDSLSDYTAKNKLPVLTYIAEMMNVGKKINYKENIVLSHDDNELTNQQSIVMSEIYQYKEPIPNMQWTLLKGDTVISGYNCLKATILFRGRTYVAWYAKDLAIPYGPYKFSNLPGLIFYLHDTKFQYNFIIDGLKRVKFYDPIYVYTKKDIISPTRNNVRKAYKNYCADPGKAIMNTGKVKLTDEDLAKIQPHPYNPIELE